MMTKQKALVFVLTAALALVAIACDRELDEPTGGELSVTTTTYPLTYMTERIGGERVNVTQLVKPGVEAHDFEPAPSDVLSIINADLFVFNHPEFESWALDAANTSASDRNSTTPLITVQTIDLEFHDDHDGGHEVESHEETRDDHDEDHELHEEMDEEHGEEHDEELHEDPHDQHDENHGGQELNQIGLPDEDRDHDADDHDSEHHDEEVEHDDHGGEDHGEHDGDHEDKHADEGDHDEHQDEEHEDEHAGHDDHDHGIDAHVWLNPLEAKEQAERILSALVAADPEGAQDYTRNADALLAEFDALDELFETKLGSCKLDHVVVSHLAFGHMAHRYGFEQIGLAGLSAEFESGPAQIAHVIEQIDELGIGHIMQEPIISDRLAETVSTETGVELLMLHPLEVRTAEEASEGIDYNEIMKANADSLATALQCN